MSGPPVFSTVMWAPSDKYGPLVTRRRGSGTMPHIGRGTQPCSASRRGSVDARARSTSRPVCTATTNSLGLSTEPKKKAAKSVKWLLEDYKSPPEESKDDKSRMPTPVRVKNTSVKSVSRPPSCRPFHTLELPVYHPDDVRIELTGRLLKTLNDVVPLGQVGFAELNYFYCAYDLQLELHRLILSCRLPLCMSNTSFSLLLTSSLISLSLAWPLSQTTFPSKFRYSFPQDFSSCLLKLPLTRLEY
jgi:hypothetical protein